MAKRKAQTADVQHGERAAEEPPKTASANRRAEGHEAARAARRKTRRSRKTARPARAREAPQAAAEIAKPPRQAAARRGSRRQDTPRLDRAAPHAGRDDPDAAVVARTWTAAASAARTGRAEIEQSRAEHGAMTPAITAGDVDVNVENAYFSGDEAPGGDNPTPDQDVVDDIGRRVGDRVPGQRGAARQRQGRRARQAPVGAGSGFVRGLQGEKVGAGGSSRVSL